MTINQNTTPPRVSIVMLNYNGIRYIKRTLSPLFELDYPNYEILVVDNGSTDGSLEYLKEQKVNLVQSPRVGEKNFACNFAVERASGEYILLMDNDVILQEDTLLQHLVKRHSELPCVGEIGLCFSDEHTGKVQSYGMYLGPTFSKILPPIENFHFPKDQRIGFADGKALFIRKDTWLKVGGYDDHLAFGGDDNDLGIKLWLMGCANYLYSDSVHLHIGMPERTDTKKYAYKFRKMVHAHLYTILKDYSLPNIYLYFTGYLIFSFLKAIKQSVVRINTLPLFAWILGIWDFIVDLPYLRVARARIQGNRTVSTDIFLNIV